LIKGCVCHYAIQFYQPFERENEKISRLWQTLLLMQEHPLFEFLPWEKEILPEKKKYYSKLPGRDLSTDTSEFVNYMLEIINSALSNLLESCRKSISAIDRIRYFYTLGHLTFTRKDYMRVHKNISTATASRDLNLGVETGFFIKHGMDNQTTYKCYMLSE
jgi:Fic family protein